MKSSLFRLREEVFRWLKFVRFRWRAVPRRPTLPHSREDALCCGERSPSLAAAQRDRDRGPRPGPPDLVGAHTRWQATKRYYARNQAMVNDSDRIIAFVAPERTGGTEDTIRRAERAGKPIEVR